MVFSDWERLFRTAPVSSLGEHGTTGRCAEPGGGDGPVEEDQHRRERRGELRGVRRLSTGAEPYDPEYDVSRDVYGEGEGYAGEPETWQTVKSDTERLFWVCG